jgi:hypothetical protein
MHTDFTKGCPTLVKRSHVVKALAYKTTALSVSTTYLFPSPCDSFCNSRPQLLVELYGCCHAVGSPLTQNHIVSLFFISSLFFQLIPTTALPCLAFFTLPYPLVIASSRSTVSRQATQICCIATRISLRSSRQHIPSSAQVRSSRRLSRSPPLTGLRLMCIHQSRCFSSNGLSYLHCHVISGSAFPEGRFAVPVMTSTISSKDHDINGHFP